MLVRLRKQPKGILPKANHAFNLRLYPQHSVLFRSGPKHFQSEGKVSELLCSIGGVWMRKIV